MACAGISAPAVSLSQECTAAKHCTANWRGCNPAELLFSEDSALPEPLRERPGLRRLPPWHFDHESATRPADARNSRTHDLSGFGCDRSAHLALGAAGALLQYVRDTQRSTLPHLRGLRSNGSDMVSCWMPPAAATWNWKSACRGDHEHTLAGVLDRTATAMGSRCLRRWMQSATARPWPCCNSVITPSALLLDVEHL